MLAHLYTYGKVPKTSSTFLKGTKKEKLELKNENTSLFCQIQVSDVRRRHMVPGIPKNYAMLFSQYVAMNMTVSIQSAKSATARSCTGSQVARVCHYLWWMCWEVSYSMRQSPSSPHKDLALPLLHQIRNGKENNNNSNNNNNNNIFISYIKYTNITPPANSKANRGRWCVDGLRFITNSWSEKVQYL